MTVGDLIAQLKSLPEKTRVVGPMTDGTFGVYRLHEPQGYLVRVWLTSDPKRTLGQYELEGEGAPEEILVIQ